MSGLTDARLPLRSGFIVELRARGWGDGLPELERTILAASEAAWAATGRHRTLLVPALALISKPMLTCLWVAL